MAIFNETSTGGLITGGCAKLVYVDYVIAQFGPGDILWSIPKARRGVYEKVVIKKAKIARTQLTQGQPVVLYVDTFNALWNEDELTDRNTADILVEDYENFYAEVLRGVKCFDETDQIEVKYP